VLPATTVLCIDDEAIGLKVRKLVLERAGYHVLTATDGESGIQMFQQEAVDVVLLDFSMPGMNGDEVAVALRAAKPAVPIVLLSAFVSLPERMLTLVDACLTKGEGPESMLHKLRDVLAAYRGGLGHGTSS
jgi:CheY-like chemotaxis protein